MPKVTRSDSKMVRFFRHAQCIDLFFLSISHQLVDGSRLPRQLTGYKGRNGMQKKSRLQIVNGSIHAFTVAETTSQSGSSQPAVRYPLSRSLKFFSISIIPENLFPSISARHDAVDGTAKLTRGNGDSVLCNHT